MAMTLTQTLTQIDRLKRRLHVAYEFALPDEPTLAEIIYRHRAAAYQAAMTEQARTAGSRRRGHLPTGMDARYLKDVSLDDARSIRATFEKDLDREIERLYAANPDGRRDYYVSNLTTWADERAAWKDRQIALMNNKTARFYAQQRFKDMNKVTANYRFAGPAPVCEDCADKFALGEVGQSVVDVDPTPLHPNCPHEWIFTNAKIGLPLDQLWVG
jgi:hypothetical protein